MVTLRKTRLTSLLLGAALLAVLLVWPRVGDSSAAEPSICRERTVVDYALPFRKMPAVHPPPKSGKLPFAPRFSRFYEAALGPLQVEGGGFGYAFSGVAPPAKAVRLDWQIETRVLEVDRRGRTKSAIVDRQEIVRTVHNMAKLDFWVRLPKRPAFYRYVIEFSQLDGKRLAEYSEYVRIVPKHLRAVLRADASVIEPTGTVRFQIANFGTVPISFGEGVEVEYFDGLGWSPSSFFNYPRVRKPARVLSAGQAGPCEPLAIPVGAPPGRYRAAKGLSPLMGDRITAVTQFQVVVSR